MGWGAQADAAVHHQAPVLGQGGALVSQRCVICLQAAAVKRPFFHLLPHTTQNVPPTHRKCSQDSPHLRNYLICAQHRLGVSGTPPHLQPRKALSDLSCTRVRMHSSAPGHTDRTDSWPPAERQRIHKSLRNPPGARWALGLGPWMPRWPSVAVLSLGS